MTGSGGLAVRQGTARGAGVWSLTTSRSEDAVRGLEDEWRDLQGRCRTATPFQSHAWLTSWWRAYGTPGTLRVVQVRREGRLVALAPMMVRRQWGVPVLSFLGQGVSDFADVLLDDEHAEEAARALGRALLSVRGWRAIDLREVRPDAAAGRLFDVWPAGRWRSADSTCLRLADESFDDLLGRLPGRTAGKVRAKLRKADAHGIAVRAVGADEAATAVTTLLDLHREQWSGRTIETEHLRPRFARHLTGALPGMVRAGEAALFEYRDGDRVVGCDILLVGRDVVGGYLYGIHPDLMRAVDVAAVLVRQAFAVKQERRLGEFSLLRGEEEPKMRWRPETVANQRLILGRPHDPSALAYVWLLGRRDALAETAKTRLSPSAQARLRRFLSR